MGNKTTHNPSPTIEKLTEKVEVDIGDTATLACKVAYGKYFRWTRRSDGKIMDKEDHKTYVTRFSRGICELQFLNVGMKDDGDYICTVEDDNGSMQTATQQLCVRPSIDVVVNRGEIGGNAQIICKLTNAKNASWTRWDKKISLKANNAKYKERFSGDVCELEISGVNMEDEGKYICSVEGLNGCNAEKMVFFSIFCPSPCITTTTGEELTTATVGSDVTIKCNATNAEVARWTIKGKDIDENNPKYKVNFSRNICSLEIRGVEVEDDGDYVCTVANKIGKIKSKTLSVGVRPIIQIVRDKYLTCTNSSAVLECQVKGANRCVWTFYDQEACSEKQLQVPSVKYVIDKKDFTLTILQVQCKDQGKYTCTAVNDHTGLQAESEAITLETVPFYDMIRWGDKKQKQEILDKIKDTDIEDARIVLYGHRGAGKSSFINSLETAAKGDLSTITPQGKVHESKTTKVSFLKIGDLAFTICDIPGFVDTTDVGNIDYVVLNILNNKVEDRTEINDTELKHEVVIPAVDGEKLPMTCVVYVVDCETIDDIPDATVERIKRLQKEIEKLQFQMVVLITKIDKLVKTDLSNIFGSDEMRSHMEKLSNKIGIDEMCLYPVQNYSNQTGNDDDMDTILLYTLRCILKRIEDIGVAYMYGSQQEAAERKNSI